MESRSCGLCFRELFLELCKTEGPVFLTFYFSLPAWWHQLTEMTVINAQIMLIITAEPFIGKICLFCAHRRTFKRTYYFNI